MSYMVQSPVLRAFNRPDLAEHIFRQVRTVKPARLYMAADGACSGDLCAATGCTYENIDWPCQVYKDFNQQHKDGRIAVAAAITWFFAQEEGIILEDDRLPVIDFYLQKGQQKDAGYFFLDKDFLPAEKWWKFEKNKLLRRRFKRWACNLFKKNPQRNNAHVFSE